VLWTIAVVLVILWFSGLLSGYTTNNYIHIAFVMAIIAMLLQVEDDCSDIACGRTRGGYSRRRVVSKEGNTGNQ
jgi:hypothetical protein